MSTNPIETQELRKRKRLSPSAVVDYRSFQLWRRYRTRLTLVPATLVGNGANRLPRGVRASAPPTLPVIPVIAYI
jgi:hypothetical protein